MSRIRNLTPHNVHLHHVDGRIQTVPPETIPARLGATERPSGAVITERDANGTARAIRAVRAEFGEPTGLPEPEQGVTLIVSGMLVDALPERHDLVAPHDIVRDDEGRIVGCRALRRAAPRRQAGLAERTIEHPDRSGLTTEWGDSVARVYIPDTSGPAGATHRVEHVDAVGSRVCAPDWATLAEAAQATLEPGAVIV